MITELDTPIRSAMMFRLLFGTQDDRYEPESAQWTVSVGGNLDHNISVARVQFDDRGG